VPYDVRWDARARDLISRLQRGLDGVAVRIEHIGSTAVPGLGARPIIDIQVSVADVHERFTFEPRLNALGYEHFAFPELPIDDYLVFVPADGSNTEHVAICEANTAQERRHLALRDFLTECPEAAHEYETEKRRSAAVAQGSREAYAAGKNCRLQQLEAQALAWFEGSTPVATA
jgi:GrpB-like predicted nucleotidyltransferase (UPF0157 family)